MYNVLLKGHVEQANSRWEGFSVDLNVFLLRLSNDGALKPLGVVRVNARTT